MKQINYILVNETGNETAVRAIGNSTVSELRYHNIIVNAPRKWQVPGFNERRELLDQLVFLRRHNPDAKIFGISEVDPSASHAPVRVNPEMNALRSEMSDLP
jgi:hypothetical protein